MASHALMTFAAIFLAIVFFSVPLILKYHVYRPQSKRVVAGDVVKVHGRLSSVWCQGVDLDSESNFKAFIFDAEPDVDESDVERTVSTHRMVLPNRAQEYWGFHLLKGSHVEVSACARLNTADLTIVKGKTGLKECLLDYNMKLYKQEFSFETSVSDSVSDEDTSSISSSQGVLPNDTEPIFCSRNVARAVISTSYNCKHPHHGLARKHTLFQKVEDNDHYYYIFSSNTYLDILPNEFNVQFSIDRTHYNYSSSSNNCTESNHCHLPIDLGSEPQIVVQVAGVNGTLQELKIVMACKPREWLFLVFYSMFLLMIFLCAFQ